jgi:hypothetical protein
VVFCHFINERLAPQMACAGKRDGWGPHSTQGSVKCPKADIPNQHFRFDRYSERYLQNGLMGIGAAFVLRSLVVPTPVATMQIISTRLARDPPGSPFVTRRVPPALPGAV